MSLVSALKTLLIPRKSSAQTDDLDTDWRAIEIWAKQVVDYINTHGIIEITSVGGTVTITNPFGPVTNLEASGGGSGITDLLNGGGLTITNPTGPTTTVEVTGYPFPQYDDGSANVGFGTGAFVGSTPGNGNSAFGFNTLQAVTSGHNTAVGSAAANGLTSGSNATALGFNALFTCTTGADNTAVGASAGLGITTGGTNTGVGAFALRNVTTGLGNTSIGRQAGGSTLTTGSHNTFIGGESDASAAGVNYASALGFGTKCGHDGGVAIGVDHTGTAAVDAAQDCLALGTALHQVQVLNNQTGAGSAALGANCPASTLTAPQTWFKMLDGAGNTVYVPAWK